MNTIIQVMKQHSPSTRSVFFSLDIIMKLFDIQVLTLPLCPKYVLSPGLLYYFSCSKYYFVLMINVKIINLFYLASNDQNQTVLQTFFFS